MIFVAHRVNTLSHLKKIDKSFGIEVDLRDNFNGIYVQHDPFKKGILFDEYIKYFNHKFLICNIKSERIELEVARILKKKKIKNYFFLDSSFPMLVSCIKKKLLNQSLRFSKFENLPNTSFFNSVKWIWLDTFDGLPSDNIIKMIKNKNKKICLVSPELHKIKVSKKKLKFFLKKNFYHIDMICTKEYLFKNWTI